MSFSPISAVEGRYQGITPGWAKEPSLKHTRSNTGPKTLGPVCFQAPFSPYPQFSTSRDYSQV